MFLGRQHKHGEDQSRSNKHLNENGLSGVDALLKGRTITLLMLEDLLIALQLRLTLKQDCQGGGLVRGQMRR